MTGPCLSGKTSYQPDGTFIRVRKVLHITGKAFTAIL